MTQLAVIKFKKQHGLIPRDGVVNPQTWERLLESPAASAPSISTSTRRWLRQGSKGESVVLLQTLLAAHGHYRARVDGDFGPLTEAAVREFQAAERKSDPRVAVDGVVGPQTWGLLTR